MKPVHSFRIPPVALPIIYFMTVILLGAFLLMAPFCRTTESVSFLDVFFTSTSAVCVTGLAVFDTGKDFTVAGQTVILFLIQMGGLGIMTFSSLAFYLLKKRVSFNDRITVGQSLLHDTSFHLGKFLIRIFIFTFAIEGAGALLLYFLSSGFTPFSAVFHAISAFCNAGFSLFTDSLMGFRGNFAVNGVIAALIISGGLGFSVLVELQMLASEKIKGVRGTKLSWHSAVVLKTTVLLILVGTVFFFFAEYSNTGSSMTFYEKLLTSFFQSVTARTAGFNTTDTGSLTNVSLLFLIILMFIGGAPGSCAGGVKVTTFRVIAAFIAAQIRGRSQAVIGRYAVETTALNKAVTLIFFSLVIIAVSVLVLDFTEGGDISHLQLRGQFIEIFFEAVSALGTVGLSTGITAELSAGGKIVIILLMFIGRLGPLVFLAVIQSLRRDVYYTKPEEIIGIG